MKKIYYLFFMFLFVFIFANNVSAKTLCTYQGYVGSKKEDLLQVNIILDDNKNYIFKIFNTENGDGKTFSLTKDELGNSKDIYFSNEAVESLKNEKCPTWAHKNCFDNGDGYCNSKGIYGGVKAINTLQLIDTCNYEIIKPNTNSKEYCSFTVKIYNDDGNYMAYPLYSNYILNLTNNFKCGDEYLYWLTSNQVYTDKYNINTLYQEFTNSYKAANNCPTLNHKIEYIWKPGYVESVKFYFTTNEIIKNNTNDNTDNDNKVDEIKQQFIGNITCGNIEYFKFPASVPKITSLVYNLLKISIPVILVIMGMMDMLKAASAQKEDEMKKAEKKFVSRLIAGICALLVFIIVETVINLIANKTGNDNAMDCVNCFINGIEHCTDTTKSNN